MTTEDTIEFEIEVSAKDTSEGDLDEMTRNLLNELKGGDVVSAELVSAGTAPQGSKGDAVTLGMLALEVLPTTAPSIVALVQAWVMRGHGRTVKFKSKGIEFEGSPEEFQKLLATFGKRQEEKMSGKFALVIGNTEYTDPGLAQLTAPR
ncbi:MAG: hypothetical protein IT314_08355 [Anaerolineales bacterium]|nr:hypothetical protein [Anaerolineales bacterium]